MMMITISGSLVDRTYSGQTITRDRDDASSRERTERAAATVETYAVSCQHCAVCAIVNYFAPFRALLQSQKSRARKNRNKCASLGS